LRTASVFVLQHRGCQAACSGARVPHWGVAVGGRNSLRATATPRRSVAQELSKAEENAQKAADDLNRGLTDANKRAEALSDNDVKGDMLEPSIVNKNPIRGLVIVAALAAAARGTGFLPAQAAATTHLLAWGCLVGINVWTTFFAGVTMFKNLPRQVFGRLQAKLFPQYFWLSTGSSLLALATLFYSGTGILRPQAICLGVALGGSVVNLAAVEPIATSVMLDRHKLENAQPRDNERIKALYKQFGIWHGLSALLNLGVLVAAVAHGWYLAASMLSLPVV